jgi:hypothetical protein
MSCLCKGELPDLSWITQHETLSAFCPVINYKTNTYVRVSSVGWILTHPTHPYVRGTLAAQCLAIFRNIPQVGTRDRDAVSLHHFSY